MNCRFDALSAPIVAYKVQWRSCACSLVGICCFPSSFHFFQFLLSLCPDLGRVDCSSRTCNACTCYSSNRSWSKFAFAPFAGHLAPCGVCAACCHLNAGKFVNTLQRWLESGLAHDRKTCQVISRFTPSQFDMIQPHILYFLKCHAGTPCTVWYHSPLSCRSPLLIIFLILVGLPTAFFLLGPSLSLEDFSWTESFKAFKHIVEVS